MNPSRSSLHSHPADIEPFSCGQNLWAFGCHVPFTHSVKMVSLRIVAFSVISMPGAGANTVTGWQMAFSRLLLSPVAYSNGGS